MDPRPSRLAGALGVTATALSLSGLPLYFTAAVPGDAVVLTRVLLGMLGVSALLVFFVVWGEVIRAAAAGPAWVASTVTAAAAAWVVVTLVHLSLQAGTVIAAPAPVDPTVDGPLAPAQFLLRGSVGRLLTAVVLLASAVALRGGRAGPAWLGGAAVAVAVVQLAFVPSLYFGPDPSRFYSAVGWGGTALAPALVAVWVLALSQALVRGRPLSGAPA